MLRSFRVGSLFGIDLYIHSTFFLLPLLVVASSPARGLADLAWLLVLVFAVFGCVVLHELGHALMARRFGIGTLDITLYPIGGVARLERLPERPTEELLIAVAGPAVNVAIAALLAPLLVLGDFLSRGLTAAAQPAVVSVGLAFLDGLLRINVWLVLFNMLPTFPMDGGRVLRALLGYRMNLVKATTVAVVVGRVLIVAGLGALLVFDQELLMANFMLPVVALFVFYVGQQELAAIRYREAARQAAQPVPIPMLRHGLFEPAEMGVGPGFSGITWDQQSGVGIHWYNGRPVGTFTLPTE